MTLSPHQPPAQSTHPQFPPTGAIPHQRQPEPVTTAAPPPRRAGWYGLAAVLVLVAIIVALGVSTRTATPPLAAAPTAPTAVSPTSTAPTTPAPAAAPEPAPQTFTGTGDQVVRLAAPLDYAVVSFACATCSGNVVVKADDALLVNEIGRYSGKTIYGLSGASTSSPLTRLQVNAKGSWTMTVGGLSTARRLGAFPATGTGDDVLLVSSPKDQATLSHDGSSNFAVWAATQRSGTDLVVNEIGRYNGTVILPADGGAMLIAITADGDWSLT